MSGPAARQTRALPIPEGLEGQRIDQVVSRLLGLSRTVAAELVVAGDVTVDGAACASKSDRVSAGSWLEVVLPPPPEDVRIREAEPVEGLDVVFDDDDIVVVSKPVGVAAHSSPGWSGPTVTGGLAAAGYRLSSHGPDERQGIVHRLDVGTSGLMVVAKSEAAYSELKRAFKERRVSKRYRAVAQGHPDPLSGTVDAPIGRHPRHDYKWAVVADGKPSVTHYDTIEVFPGASLMDLGLETGRTHQIRVHFSALGHPLAGDLTYGADPTMAEKLGLTRQWLHAYRLEFVHPTQGRTVTFTSEYPEDLATALARLRADS
ncbi:RluA family pseudouridine synthase [Glycomyces harbinensis]|uniref:Pseudouridine synthase n=1 Tax=Glycomyces harbinensis TaxID=58114 RepID=A0A1G6SPC8_9ACTN|nr:RluA family pseudouridine synthase [Glycomyces harbinensis]SDD18752.1 23S rRNA pseudouridine1911/1915/1917 synthase [Glycomyces harbinensis]